MNIDLNNINFDTSIHKKYDQSYITRYAIVCEIVRQIKKQKRKKILKILDLGGYNGAARQLLPEDQVTILDVFNDETLPDYIQVNDVGIPREDNSFDIVISTDVLEHIPMEKRSHFVSEAIRVSRMAIVIAAPFEYADKSVAYEEFMANSIYQGQTSQDYIWLKEHREYKLPTNRWMKKQLDDMSGISYETFSHTSLRLWSELLSVGYFFANNVLPASKKVANKLKKLNNVYFKNISSKDFPISGYRTVYVISKLDKKVTIKTPPYEERLINDFSGKIRRQLGSSVAELVSQLSMANEDVKAHVKDQEQKEVELTALRAYRNSVEKSRIYKVAKILKR